MSRSIRLHARSTGLTTLLVTLLVGLGACGDDVPVTNQRGVISPAGNQPPGSRRSASPPPQGGLEQAPAEDFERPKRAELTREDFSGRSRDPFHNYMAAQQVGDLAEPVEIVRKERAVKLSEYTFDELRLIAIVNAGRNIAPRALFLSSDNKSKSVRQGEYFSSAEVLLASVNRDYIEIEIVDPELTPGWNLERGDRKVIHLKEK